MLLASKLTLGIGFATATTAITFFGNAGTEPHSGDPARHSAPVAEAAASGVGAVAPYGIAVYGATGTCPCPCDWAGVFAGR